MCLDLTVQTHILWDRHSDSLGWCHKVDTKLVKLRQQHRGLMSHRADRNPVRLLQQYSGIFLTAQEPWRTDTATFWNYSHNADTNPVWLAQLHPRLILTIQTQILCDWHSYILESFSRYRNKSCVNDTATSWNHSDNTDTSPVRLTQLHPGIILTIQTQVLCDWHMCGSAKTQAL